MLALFGLLILLLFQFISRDSGETEVHVFQHGVSNDEYSRQLEYMKSL